MSFLFPDAPTPPNPYQTAGAQTGTNVGTAVANAYLNQVNQNTPTGSLNYNTTGNYAWTDPTNGMVYNIPQFTATQTLSPQQQAIQGQTEATQYNLAGMANAQSGRISGLLSNEVNYGGVPAGGDAGSIAAIPKAMTGFGGSGEIHTKFGDAGELTRDYGPEDNFSADRQRVEEALYGRLNPQLDRERGNIEQRLADQGIRYGSPAYKQAMDDYNRQSNDLRLGVTAQGGQEQQRLNQMEAQRAAFQNTAQQQAFQQAMARAGFANEGQQQQFGQDAGRAAFYNQGLAQELAARQSAFNAAQAGRASSLNEVYARRNQPINEISALLNGGQVTNPNFVNAPSSQIPTTDIAGLVNKSYDQQFGNYQQSSKQTSDLLGGVLGAIGGIYKSDERSKDDIRKLGTVFAYDVDKDKPAPGSVIGEKKELPIYEYSYKDDPANKRHVGPMAQDVEKIDKGAVLHDKRGTKYLDRRRVMGNILRAA